MSALLNATRLAPSLTASDLEKSIRFYTEGLGFEIVDKGEGDDGKLRYVMMKGGNAFLGVGRDDFAKGRDRVKGTALRFWITTSQDIAVIAAKVKAAGFTIETEPAPLPWGPMAFTVVDPDGFNITVTTGE